jgi:hypothetical protein
MQEEITMDPAGLADLKVVNFRIMASDVPSKKRNLRAIGPAGNTITT